MEGFSDDELSRRLKEAVSDIEPDAALREKVRRAVAADRRPASSRRWWWLLGVVSVLLVAVFVSRPKPSHHAEEIALEIHTRCGVRHLLSREKVADEAAFASLIKQRLAPGLSLADVHQCSWKTVRFTHVLLTSGDQVMSLLILPEQPSMHAGQMGIAGPRWPSSITEHGLRLSELALPRDAIFLISSLPKAEHEAIAQALRVESLPLAKSQAPHQSRESWLLSQGGQFRVGRQPDHARQTLVASR